MTSITPTDTTTQAPDQLRPSLRRHMDAYVADNAMLLATKLGAISSYVGIALADVAQLADLVPADAPGRWRIDDALAALRSAKQVYEYTPTPVCERGEPSTWFDPIRRQWVFSVCEDEKAVFWSRTDADEAMAVWLSERRAEAGL